ncbi:hypothetical protein [Shinella sp. M27]|uniref:hypothetical protein n=1 Tax=Shinella sp. M27 TaxID=3368614 RepID=UPI003BA1B369
MVILVFKGALTDANRQRTALRQILKDANYETRNLPAKSGVENREARHLVRLIQGAMICTDRYPLSQASLHKNRNNGLDVWENEGGSANPNRLE